MGAFMRKMKAAFPAMEQVCVWHALCRYWGGLRPGTPGLPPTKVVAPKFSSGLQRTMEDLAVDKIVSNGVGLIEHKRAQPSPPWRVGPSCSLLVDLSRRSSTASRPARSSPSSLPQLAESLCFLPWRGVPCRLLAAPISSARPRAHLPSSDARACSLCLSVSPWSICTGRPPPKSGQTCVTSLLGPPWPPRRRSSLVMPLPCVIVVARVCVFSWWCSTSGSGSHVRGRRACSPSKLPCWLRPARLCVARIAFCCSHARKALCSSTLQLVARPAPCCRELQPGFRFVAQLGPTSPMTVCSSSP
ncbi:hypothetical protein ZEAMMB73_Zm00001d027882 [Zea mays]|uniref:Uncharacterized protein n=1 Tax=Zea mays TaxID=4577 RepID=A0A1D6JQC6_MAIZE|nr:hypothetical protein ZEAMMB73_Zm00001d027882 [Zea mays]